MSNTTIAIASGKGGVGKTTICANIAILLAKAGKTVIAVDMDFGLLNLHHILGIDCGVYSLINAADKECSVEDTIIPHPTISNLSYVAGSQDKGYSELGGKLPAMVEALTRLKSKCDCLLLDAPAGIGGGFLLCSKFADRIFLVSIPESCSMSDVSAAAEKLRSFGIKNDKIRLILNRIHVKMVKRKKHFNIDEAIDRSLIQLIGAIPESDLFLKEDFTPLKTDRKHVLNKAMNNLTQRIINPDTPFEYFW